MVKPVAVTVLLVPICFVPKSAVPPVRLTLSVPSTPVKVRDVMVAFLVPS